VPNDLLWLVLSYAYVLAVGAAGSLARISGRKSPELTRKIIHVGVGMWIVPTVIVFENPLVAAIPPATFVFLNALSYKFRLVPAMEEGDRNPGTIYFPLAFVLLIFLFWPGSSPFSPSTGSAEPQEKWSRFPVAGGIMVMAWGDAAASVLGRAFGRRKFRLPGGSFKSLEGSLAFMAFSFPAILLAGAAVGLASGIEWRSAIAKAAGPALGATLVAAALEAATPWGLDNLSVPLAAACVLSFLTP
jgi:dolichol kinase